MGAEGRPAILLMFSVKLVQEDREAGELIPDQHAVPGTSQPRREPAGEEGTAHTDPGSDDGVCGLTVTPKVRK